MGFLDKLVEVTKNMANERAQGAPQQGQPSQEKSLLEGVVDMFKRDGVNGIMQQFKDRGLEDTVKSWIGTGSNRSISSGQVRDVLGQERISQLAQKAGVSEDRVAEVLKDVLPDAVDRATPGGTVEPLDPDQKQ